MTTPATTYTQLRSAIAREIQSGALNLRDAYQQQLLRTHWKIGLLMNEAMRGTIERRTSAYARTIEQLARDFKRSKPFFYMLCKFHREYPVMPATGLGWAQYSLLLKVDDPRARAVFERKAIRDHWGYGELRQAIIIRKETAAIEVMRVTPTKHIPVARGRLYHYKALVNVFGAPSDKNLVRIDAGFGIEREVRLEPSRRLGRPHIVRVIKAGKDYAILLEEHRPEHLYTYKATIIKVIDGDTMLARIDLGFHTWVTEKLRLRAIDAPNARTTRGIAARRYVADKLKACPCVVVKTYKAEKYGRYLADIFYLKGEPGPQKILQKGAYLNQELLDKKLAVIYEEPPFKNIPL